MGTSNGSSTIKKLKNEKNISSNLNDNCFYFLY
jgi:hypothetical protein